jgi:tRNA dimethylallyltransferase
MATADHRTLILTGPTATGKTALALALAAHLPIEIISVDSALVYRGMDIGTAKPSAAELDQVPHHLIDIIDPTDSYSAARFVQDTQAAMADIRARGKLPLLVGGTMLYIKALIDGMDEIPPVPDAIRDAIDAEAAIKGWPAMHAQLLQADPTVAKRLAPNDAQRIQRALAVWRATGQPLSTFQTHANNEQGPPSQQATAPSGVVMVSLEPLDRAWLHARINGRFEQMMHGGFIDEVRTLRQNPALHLNLPSMRCVGYRQVWQALDDGVNFQDITQLASVSEAGAAATRQLAKRQITWLRSMPWRQVIDVQNTSPQAALHMALQAFSASGDQP